MADTPPPLVEALGELERGRRDRLLVVAVLVVGVVAAFGLLVLDRVVTDLAPFAAVGFLAVALGYGVTVATQEVRSQRVVRAIVAEHERAVATVARIRALEALQAAAREVVTADDLDVVFDRVLVAARSLTDADAGMVLLRVGDELTVAEATGADAPGRGETFAVSDVGGAVGQAATGDRPALELGAAVGASSIAAPMRLPDRTVGVLVVTRRATRPAFDQADLAVVALFADHAALAVRNASHLDGERRSSQWANAELDALTEDVRASLAVVTGYVALLRERGDGFGVERRRALLDDVLSELGSLRSRLGSSPR